MNELNHIDLRERERVIFGSIYLFFILKETECLRLNMAELNLNVTVVS